MKNLTIFSASIFTLLFMASCEKEIAVDNTTALPNGSMLSTFKAGKEAAATQTFTIDAEDGGTVVGSQGTRVTVGPGTLFASVNNMGVGVGNPLTGDVVITLIEVYNKKDMVFMNKPTMGIINDNPTDTLSTLVSGGEYYLKITKNNAVVYAPNGVLVHLPVENLGGPDPDMSQFDGAVNASGNLIWTPTTTAVTIVEVPTDTTGQTGEFVSCYQILDNQWGWTNVDRFYGFPGPTTILKAKLPTGFDPTNTEVYLSYDGEPGALAALDIYTTDGFFSEHYGLIPIGLAVHFIAVTYLDGQLHYAIQAATIDEDHVETITAFHPTTQAELATLINALP